MKRDVKFKKKEFSWISLCILISAIVPIYFLIFYILIVLIIIFSVYIEPSLLLILDILGYWWIKIIILLVDILIAYRLSKFLNKIKSNWIKWVIVSILIFITLLIISSFLQFTKGKGFLPFYIE